MNERDFSAVDEVHFALSLVSVRSACAPALCYDSGIYATTCDGSCCSGVTLPEEKHEGQNSHIRKDLMPGCISLDHLC